MNQHTDLFCELDVDKEVDTLSLLLWDRRIDYLLQRLQEKFYSLSTNPL